MAKDPATVAEVDDCMDWGPPAAEGLPDEAEAPRSSYCGAICTMGVSVPGLVGTWCWPILVGYFFGLAYNQIDVGLEKTFYALELTVAAVLFTNMLQFSFWRCGARRGPALSHWQKWDGAYWMALATLFSLPFPTAVVFIYVGEIAPYPANKMWHSGSWAPNTPHGIVLYIMKWLGTVFLTIGVMKTTLLHRKIIKKWQQIRPQSPTKTEPA